ncbi:MAG: hypothetical protein KGL39_32075 [Patescibacteria group bacterium]|nr:hypothetical protein [Patescibacteria group bacterium]
MNITKLTLQAGIDKQSVTKFINAAYAAINNVIAALSAKTITAQAATAYTLALSDAGNVVLNSNAAATTVTVPPNSSVAFPVGTIIDIWSTGAGGVTVAAGAGVTVGGTLTVGANTRKQLLQTAANTWVLA